MKTRITQAFFTILAFCALASAVGSLNINYPVEHYEISLDFNLEDHSFEGSAILTFENSTKDELGFLLNSNFKILNSNIESNEVKNQPINEDVIFHRVTEYDPSQMQSQYGVDGEWDTESSTLWLTKIPPKLRTKESLKISISYRGILYSPPDDRQFSREKIAFEVNGTIGTEGIYLSPSSYYYPRMPGSLAHHRFSANLPLGWNCVTSGTSVWKEEDDRTIIVHTSKVPLDGLNFSAGPYVVNSIDVNNTKLLTYFLPEQVDLAQGYQESCEGYLEMYNDLIAPYPFTKFAVVDNFLPSGYGMPGWTLLGSEVIRLPFIRFTSLGHEVLHNWFGNSLFVDYREGNWCEGITVYFADHQYKLDSDSAKAVDYRMNTLRDFAAYVTPENDYPVTEFISRVDSHDRAIGYGKVMMIFHMLNQISKSNNPEAFFKAIKRLYKEKQWQHASWSDWQKAFEMEYDRDLGEFFDQWVRKTGAPKISIENVNHSGKKNKWKADFTIITSPKDVSWQYPVTVRSFSNDGSYADHYFFLNDSEQKFQISGTGSLKSIYLDPGYDVFRTIYPNEMPQTIAEFFGNSDGVLVVPSVSALGHKYLEAATGLKKEGQTISNDRNLNPESLPSALWLFGNIGENSVWNMVPSETRERFTEKLVDIEEKLKESGGNGFNDGMILTGITPNGDEKIIMWTICIGKADPVAGTRKLPHYGKYSYLLFENDQNKLKGTWNPEGNSPNIWEVE